MASATRRRSAAQGGANPDSRAGQGRSGRLLLRMPAELHDELSRRAEDAGVSLNQLIVSTLSESAGERPERPPAAPRAPRLLGLALVANLVVVALAGAVAVGLLLLAWQG